MKRNILLYLNDIYNNILKIETFVGEMAFTQFSGDDKTNLAVIHCLEIIGEAAKYIPEDVQAKYSQVPWRNMVTMRNKIAHEYFGVNLEIVWLVVKNELPAIKSSVAKIIADPSINTDNF
jgi:uncharacterized protein with HEPN domain